MDSRYESEGEFRKAVVEELRRQGLRHLEAREWEQVRPGSLDWQMPQGREDVDDVVASLEKIRPPERRPSKRVPKARPRRRRETYLYGSDEHSRADEASRESANRPEVVKPIEDFRRDVWESDEPPFDDSSVATRWLASIPSPFATPVSFGVPQLPPYTQLEYVTPHLGVTSIVVSQDSAQGRLKDIADRLCETLGCFPAQAVSFVLTGQTPVVWPVTADFPIGPGSITLHVNHPWVSRETVQRVYGLIEEMRRHLVAASLTAEQRRQQVAAATDKLHPRVVALVRFVSVTRGLPWPQKYKVWNQRHPEWKYESASSMQVSLTQAHGRLEKTGVRLARLLATFTSREWEEKGYIRITRPPLSFPSPADVLAFDATKPRPR